MLWAAVLTSINEALADTDTHFTIMHHCWCQHFASFLYNSSLVDTKSGYDRECRRQLKHPCNLESGK
jgi:hypothetical protein